MQLGKQTEALLRMALAHLAFVLTWSCCILRLSRRFPQLRLEVADELACENCEQVQLRACRLRLSVKVRPVLKVSSVLCRCFAGPGVEGEGPAL